MHPFDFWIPVRRSLQDHSRYFALFGLGLTVVGGRGRSLDLTQLSGMSTVVAILGWPTCLMKADDTPESGHHCDFLPAGAAEIDYGCSD